MLRIIATIMLVTMLSLNAYAGSACCEKKKAEQQTECKKPCDKDGKTTESESKK